jgi:polyketide biosynthesis enoyl-CoA hydratase PksI
MERSEARTLTRKVVLEQVADGVMRLRMQDWAGTNGLSPEMVEALLTALGQVEEDKSAKVLMLCGLPEHFCSGATREVLEALGAGRLHPTELGLARQLLALDVPVIAACAGHAIGGGLVLATACDLIILARERRYGFNFMDLGITPGMGSTSLAEHVFGTARAHELLYSGECRLGGMLIPSPGVAAVAPAHEVEIRALDLALRIASKSRKNLSMLKRVLTLPRKRRLEEALTMESIMHHSSLEDLDLDGMGTPR